MATTTKKSTRIFDAQAKKGGMYLTAARKQETKAEMADGMAAQKKHTQMARRFYSQSSKVVDKGLRALKNTRNKKF